MRWGAVGLLWLCLPSVVEACVVRYFQTEARYAYRTAVLQLLLEKTADEGPCAPQPVFAGVTQDRGLALLQEGRVDVATLPTTMERERALRAVRFDILAGLLGYRVLLIDQHQLPAFARVTTLAELRHFSLGFGRRWSRRWRSITPCRFIFLSPATTRRWPNVCSVACNGP